MPNKTRKYKQKGRGNGNGFSMNNPSLLNKHGSTPLHEAVYRNNINEVARLLDTGFPIDIKNIDDDTPLHTAFSFGHYDIAKLLIDHGASLEIKDRYGRNGQWYLNENAESNFSRMKMNNKKNSRTLKNKFMGIFSKKNNGSSKKTTMSNKNRNAARRASLMSFAPRR
jgi:ankyrin repeat protein